MSFSWLFSFLQSFQGSFEDNAEGFLRPVALSRMSGLGGDQKNKPFLFWIPRLGDHNFS